MSNYNGLVALLTKGGDAGVTTLLTGVSFVTVTGSMPGKMFNHGQFAVTCTEGVSGTFAVNVFGAVGGATFIIAGCTNISDVGSFPVPLIVYGQSGNHTGTGVPRPIGVNFESAEDVAGFSASVFFAGDY